MKQMSDKIYTVEEELRQLESFLQNENIENNHNYVRMEKGPKPFLYTLITFSHQVRFTLLDFYFLVFTKDSLIILSKTKEDKFSLKNMTTIKHTDIRDFTFKEIWGADCIYFKYLDKEYYFYLSDWVTNRILDKLLNYPVKNVSHENLSYLEEMDFMGLFSNDK